MRRFPVFESFAELLDFAEKEFGDDPFLTRGSECISFSGFAQTVRSIAAGLEPGKTYCLSLQDPIKYACAYYACVIAGATAFLSAPDASPVAREAAFPELRDQDILFGTGKPSRSLPPAAIDRPCTIAFSSGTTSAKKGVMLSQKNLLTDAAFSIENYRFWRQEKILHVLPYSHLFGLVADLIAPLHSGAQVHFPSHPLRTVQEVFSFCPEVIHLPPALIDVFLSTEGFHTVCRGSGGALQKILCSGAALPEQKYAQLAALGVTPCTAYGLTECSPCVTITGDNDTAAGTVGREIGCVKLDFSEDGEILVAGDTVMLGYYQDQAATEQKILNRQLHTGDLGYRDQHGRIVLTGRKDSMLVLPSGINCSPETIEAELCRTDEIQECVIVQDRRDGAEIIVIIVLKNEIPPDKRHIRQILRRYGIEQYEVCFRMKPLPRNQLGKVIRRYVL